MVLLAGVQATYASTNAIYTVHDVKVDVTAKSAVEAREQARSQAQRQAFDILITRLVSETVAEQFNEFDDAFIGTLVQDFEVTNEKTSNVRYIGTYTFRFKKNAVQEILTNNNYAYTDVGSRPILILPFYHNGIQTVIWDAQNPWMKAWNDGASFQGLVPVIIPIGDLQDTSDIQNNQALSYAPERLSSMVQRYGAGEAIVMLALPQWSNTQGTPPAPAQNGTVITPDNITIMMYRTDTQTPELANRLNVSASDAKQGENIFDAAVRETQNQLRKDWKSKTVVSNTSENTVEARVQFRSMGEWIETQRALKQVQGVQSINVLTLTPQKADLSIVFRGSESRLRLALAQANIILTAPSVSFSPSPMSNQSILRYDLYLKKYTPSQRY